MLNRNMLRNLSNSYVEMGRVQDQLATGKKINKPSDDPVVATKGIRYRTNLGNIEQYERNLNEVNNWMEASDSALDKATSTLHRIRELAVQTSNDTYDDSQRAQVAKEVRQLKEHLADIGNSKVNDKFIFNGKDTSNKPIDTSTTPVTVSSNSDAIKIEISKGIELQVNIDPSSVFSSQLFDDIDKFITDLETPGVTNVTLDDSITNVEKHIDSMLSERATQGARQNRVELVENRLSEQKVISSRILSDNEDADIEKVISDLKIQESIHRAALSVGSRIIQPSLMDFLR
jgi:flagellar hook-associated protein 3 FlgL